MNSCSLDDLYTQFVTLIETVTGRTCWRKGGIQSQPVGSYCIIQFTQGSMSPVSPVELVALDAEASTAFAEVPWGATYLDVTVEFFRGTSQDPALWAATRFRNSLLLQDRFWDVWKYCGLVGSIRLLDVSTMFRADVEGRAEVRFQVNANITNPLPLPTTGLTDVAAINLQVYKDTDSVGNLVIDTDIPE